MASDPNKANEVKDQVLQQRTLLAKIKGVSEHLEALLQKKIRIDLEIRRTKNTLSKLRKRTSTQLKVSAAIEAESTVPEPNLPWPFNELAQEHYTEELQRALEHSEILLQEVESLEGSLYSLEI